LREDDTVLLRGRDAREQRHGLDGGGERAVAHPVDLGARDHSGDIEPDLGTDVAGHQVVVAGEHLDRHATVAQRAEGLLHTAQRRIEKRHEAGHRERPLVVPPVSGLGGDARVRHPEHAGAGRAEAPIRRLDPLARGIVQSVHGAVRLVRHAQRQDPLGRALADEQPRVAVLDHDREPATLEVERHLVDLRVAGDVTRAGGKDGPVEGTLDARLVRAVHVRQLEGAGRRAAERIEALLEDHLAAGEGARLVAAQHIHAAEIFDGFQMADDHLSPGHVHRAVDQGDRRDHGQELRREADGQRDREEQRLEGRMSEDDPGQDDEQDEQDDGPHDEQRELPRAALELRLGRARGQTRRDVAECGLRAGGDDDRGGRSAHDRRPEENAMPRVVRVSGRLLGWQRLAGERGLLHVEVAGLEEPGVGRHAVAGGEPHDVARHDGPARDVSPATIPQDARHRRHRVAEALGRAVRACGDRARGQEHDDEGVAEGGEGPADDRGAAGSGRLVGSHVGEAALGLARGQARERIGHDVTVRRLSHRTSIRCGFAWARRRSL
jgi:hypothetical protein